MIETEAEAEVEAEIVMVVPFVGLSLRQAAANNVPRRRRTLFQWRSLFVKR